MSILDISETACGHCQKTVKDTLESVSGVQQATADLAAGPARVLGAFGVSARVGAAEGEGYRATLANL